MTRPAPRPRMLVVVALAAAAGVLAGILLTRTPDPPGTPIDVRAQPFRCADPCRRLQPSISVRWSAPPGGGGPVSYEIVREGGASTGPRQVAGSATSFVDRAVTFGERYEYRVIAWNDRGASPRSEPVSVRLPTPPDERAQLGGDYRVRLTVTRARAISSMLGIQAPTPGDRATDRWTFEPVCARPLSGCPARWEGLAGELAPRGRHWRGTVAGPEARCGGGTKVDAPARFDLEATAAEGADDAWVVGSFEGSVDVSFHCPGFLASAGTVEVSGTRVEAGTGP